ncbi:MAG: hypothetical protein HQL37_09775 [Alphaproteobacteria bacterium]|nr:hypothetical protein [Alphaproteobacteria bacterium]
MIPLLERALTALDGDATALRSRRIRDPTTGKSQTVVTTVGLWRIVDEMARERGLTSEAFCHLALAEFPTLIPGEAVWTYLCRETPKLKPDP